MTQRPVVIDTGAVVRGVNLTSLFHASVYTVLEVLEEIRDRQTRQAVAALPFEITVKEPNPEDVAAVVEFARKTGDIASLSKTDVRVLALTLTLERQLNGGVHVHTEPGQVKTVSRLGPGGGTDAPRSADSASAARAAATAPRDSDASAAPAGDDTDTAASAATAAAADPAAGTAPTAAASASPAADAVPAAAATDSGVADMDDDEGWITVENVQLAKVQHGAQVEEPGDEPRAACITTDFAMQNVLVQMGLRLLSLDGHVIRRLRSFILRCESCFKTTKDMERVFCPVCGNHTLVRVAVAVDADGMTQIVSRFHRPRVRGTKYALPMPKGGRERGPVLCEDELLRYQRAHKPRETDPFSPDHEFLKPRAELPHGLQVGPPRKNVNQVRHMPGRRKKHPH